MKFTKFCSPSTEYREVFIEHVKCTDCGQPVSITWLMHETFDGPAGPIFPGVGHCSCGNTLFQFVGPKQPQEIYDALEQALNEPSSCYGVH